MKKSSQTTNSQHAHCPQSFLVLVVDDDEGMRLILRYLMEREGHRVIEAADGQQALELYQKFQPDIVLLDALMPVMDGFTCCQTLHSLYPNQAVIIMVTGMADPNLVNRAFAAGATDYVLKPIHQTILRQKVLRTTQHFRYMQQLQQNGLELEYQTQLYDLAVQERTAQLQRALALETALERIIDRVRDSLNESQIVQTAVEELAIVLGAIRCNAGFYDADQQMSNIRYEYTKGDISYRDRQLVMDGFSEVYQQLLQGMAMQFCPMGLSVSQDHTAMFVFSIQYENQPIGDIWLVFRSQRTLDDLEMRLARQVTNQCAIAIRQARLYQAAQAQVQELERLNQAKDDFLSTVSHELRSPMTNIRMAAQMLDKVAIQAQEQYGDALLQNASYLKGCTYFQIIQMECDREIELINDLLDLQRLESGERPDSLVFIELDHWLFYFIQPFQERTQERQQTFNVELAVDLPPIWTHSRGLNRILSELLNNACKYTPPGETITLLVRIPDADGDLQIDVTNTGVEIPIEEQERIFDRFYRIPQSDRWRQGGTGLGLALVKRLAACLGGSISVQSENLQTCFMVRLPIMSPALPNEA
jgi:signal transduction histidine kinase/CheY-like chemotaxis protein